MQLKQKYGNRAFVAGASEGIGAAFSHFLAKEGMDLFMVARNKEPLENLARSLEERYSVNAETLNCDLSEPDSLPYILSAVKDKSINVLVCNAALSFIGHFEEDTAEHMNRIAVANIVTPMNLVKVFGERMLGEGRGSVIIMSSLAGFQGSGFLASYAATKAFSRVFAESLWYEWKEKGVDVIACCAGATSTPKYLATNPGKAGLLAPRVTTSEEVVEECFKNLGKRPSFIAGRGNRIASFFMHRIMPRRMAVNIMGDNTGKIYRIH